MNKWFALLVSIALVGGGATMALADNPHGSKSDPNASCGHHTGQGKPSGQCNDKGLPQSNGCNPSSSPHNPHCQGGETTTTPTTPEQPGQPGQPGAGSAPPEL